MKRERKTVVGHGKSTVEGYRKGVGIGVCPYVRVGELEGGMLDWPVP